MEGFFIKDFGFDFVIFGKVFIYFGFLFVVIEIIKFDMWIR